MPSSPSSPPHVKYTKTSLDFICSPAASASSPARPPISRSRSRSRSRSQSQSQSQSQSRIPTCGLNHLSRDLLSLVAYHLVVDDNGIAGHPASLLPLLLTSRYIHDAISFDNNPQLYNHLYRATFDTAALTRRFQWMLKNMPKKVGKDGKQARVFNLFSDPRSWAIDYRSRWETSWTMTQIAKQGKVDIPGVCNKESVVTDLWTFWFLLTENDGKNAVFLDKYCHFREFIITYYKENLVQESLVPGYPAESGIKALVCWCTLLSGQDNFSENPADVDEKIFMMRPYVFACAKYDVTYAPWSHRALPLCPSDCTDHEADPSIPSKAMTYKRFGYTWKRAPPHFILGVYLMFLRLLERQPDRVGLKVGSSTFSISSFESALPGLFASSRRLDSIHHDREWQRNTVCQDPHTSPGLPPLVYRGEIQGFWRGKFLFYDFELYRDILAGNMRGVYTGTFAEQVAEMELRETLIKVRKEDVGGNGPLLFAGYKDDEEDMDVMQQRIEAGDGHELCSDDEELPEGWTKEILITGRCRTSWGWAKISGRVRAWDGLVIMAMAYSRHVMGRWLWRGYLHPGGYMIGRWRDTFTPEQLRGYEGAFGLIRANDPMYPEHFPKRMEDSLGVNLSAGVAPAPAPAPVPATALAPATMTTNEMGNGPGSQTQSQSQNTIIGRSGNGNEGPSSSSSSSSTAQAPTAVSTTTTSTGTIDQSQSQSNVRPTWRTDNEPISTNTNYDANITTNGTNGTNGTNSHTHRTRVGRPGA